MKKLYIGIFAAFALLAVTAYADAQGLAFAGKWRTTFGIMDIEVMGNQANGTYANGDGRITGTIDLDGRTLRGTWSEPQRPDQPLSSGDVIFTLTSDDNSFYGLFWHGPQEGLGGEWIGTRIE